MLWDERRGEVRPSRVKEGSHDYRYFPEPDLPPLVLAPDWIERQRGALPELPQDRRARFVRDYGLSDADVDVILASRPLADYYEGLARQHGDPKTAANWVMGEVMRTLAESRQPPDRFVVRPADLAQLLNMVRDGLLSTTAAKRVFGVMVATGDRPEQIAQRERLLLVSGVDALVGWIEEAIAAHPDEWRRLVAGERKLLGVLVAAVMQRSAGSADPRRVSQLLVERAAEGGA